MGVLNSFFKYAWNGVFNITGIDISFNIEYRDFSFYMVELKADYYVLKKRFEPIGLIPVETFPNQTTLQINSLEMRKIQFIEPYHEMSIHVPVKSLEEGKYDPLYHLHLPVTSEEARWGGVDVNGFPKTIATINIMRGEEVTECKLSNDEGFVLGYSVKNNTGSLDELTWNLYGVRNNEILRTSFEIRGNIGESVDIDDSRVIFGDQSMSKDLEALLVSNKIEKIVIGDQLSGILKKPVFIKKL